jgi:hypothetical protein
MRDENRRDRIKKKTQEDIFVFASDIQNKIIVFVSYLVIVDNIK